MWIKLQSVITEVEIESVPENLRSKIDGHLDELNRLIDDLKNENAELTAVNERQQFQFEKEISESHAQQQESAETCMSLKTQISELESNLSATQNELRELQKTNGTVCIELESLKRNHELLQEEKKSLAEQLEKRRDEIDKLNAELKRLLEEAKSATEEKHAAIAKAEEAKMHESTLQHQVNRLEQEKSLLERQISDLNSELSQRNREINVVKKEKNIINLQLLAKLDMRNDEFALLEEQVASLKEACAEKDKRLEELAEKIRVLNENAAQTEEHYQLELNAQTKLADLYKKASEDNQKRVQELVGAFEEAQKLLQESADARNEVEKNAETMENEYKAKIAALEKDVSSLQEELQHANDLCKSFSPERLETLFPAAAATSKVMRSGMTLTQMYSEYVKALEEIQNLKSDNQRLSDQLKQVVAEIEENTPVINEKMQEYQKAVDTIACLRTKLASSLTDFDKIQTELNDMKRIKNQIEKENNRLKAQVKDLSHQVQVMLKEVQDAKGGVYKSGAPHDREDLVTSSDGKTADTVITRHLVSFRDIVELQTKNQQLLAVVRELSEHQEQQEKKAIEEKTSEFRKELQSALSQLEELKKNRVKQAELVQSVIRQRDMYRVLLSNHGVSESLLGSPQGSSTLNVSKVEVSPGARSDSAKHALQQVQSEFDAYRLEKVENEKLLNKQLDKVKTELSDLRVENAKLKSQLEYSEERVNILQSNMENYKKEASFLREKNQKHSTLITQHQQTIQNLKQELLETHEKIAKSEVALENLRSERDISKGIEQRLLQEKESLFREQQQKSQILANLQAVQNNLERIESETKRNLQYQLEKAEKENSVLKAKLDSANEDYKSAVTVWEKHTKELQHKIDAEVEKNRKLHEDLVDAYSRMHATSQELSAAKAALGTAGVSAEKKPADTAAAKGKTQLQQLQTELKSLKDQLNDSQNKVKALQEQLDLSKKSSEHYMKICNDLELRVKEQDEINKQLKDSMDGSLTSQTAKIETLEQNLKEAEKTNRNLIAENVKITEEKNTKIHELEAQVNALKSVISANKDSMETAMQTANQARADCMAQKKLSDETEAKYERELMLHAENVKAYTDLKEEHEHCVQKIEELSRAAKEAKETLEAHKASWTEREALLLKEQEALKERISDLEAQNRSLLNELELIGTQMTALQSKTAGELPSLPADIDLKDTQHLLQIIQFVKKEKEIISTKYDSTQSENVRLKLKLEQTSSELEEFKKELKELQDSSQTRAMTDTQHAELLRKIEMMNLLTESNNLLRMEKEKLVETNKELEQKLSEIELKTKPLTDTVKDMQSQLEFASAENAALKQEVAGWKSRTNQLLEQSHRIGPQEYKSLTKELEELRSQKTRLAEELQRKQSDLSQTTSTVIALRRELESSKNNLQEKMKQIFKMEQDIAEHHKTMLQVKKIGRKYKTQYDELKVAYDALVAKTKTTESAAQDSSLTEMQKKLEDDEKTMKDLKEEAEKQKERFESVLKQASEKEEKAKKLLAQVRQRYNQINSQREVLEKEKTALSKELEEVKGKVSVLNRSAGEESLRSAAERSELDAKVTRLEREVKALRESKDTLERQYEEVCQKLAQQQKQTAKPTAVGGIVDRGSGSSEPLTANIKPLSTPTQPGGPGLRHAASPSPRSTPTASIRPMAIGTVGASTSSQARMAAVLPTTVATSATPPASDEGNVPQAAVQPTPATATVAPTTVAVTLTPSSHTPVISEVTPASDTLDTVTVDSPAPTTSVIVSPPATQTQMVQPTVKRPREEGQGPSSPDNAAAAPKRVRMVSEGSQTNQQAAAISPAQPITSLPVATVVSRAKVEAPVVPEVPKPAVLEPVPSTSGTLPVVQPSTSAVQTAVKSEPAVTVTVTDTAAEGIESERKDGTPVEWEPVDEMKPEGDLEVMEEEDADTQEQMEAFEDEAEIEVEYPAESRDDETMAEDPGDVEEMAEPVAESPAETIDDGSENPMEAENLPSAAAGDQCMAPPSFPITQVSDSASVPESVLGGSCTPSQTRRAAQLAARVPMRQDRIPSVGRQHLPPFTIPDQPARFEDGDDSIVPSTPTLFVPRRTDGFAEAVSSPHVPSVRFLFSNSDSSPTQQGLSQLASQGALGVDDTRMDLSQFDDGSGRTVPSTPQQVSPSEAAVPDIPEVVVEQVPLEQVIDSAVPVSTVAAIVEQEQVIVEATETKQQSQTVEPETGVEVKISEAKAIEEEPKDIQKQGVASEAKLPGDGAAQQPGGSAADTVPQTPKDGELQPSSETELQTQASLPVSSVRKPIVWGEQGRGAASRDPSPASSTSPSSAASAVPSQQHPSAQPTGNTEPPARGVRARRMRYRGATNTSMNVNMQRGPTSWTPRRGRGNYRRGRMF